MLASHCLQVKMQTHTLGSSEPAPPILPAQPACRLVSCLTGLLSLATTSPFMTQGPSGCDSTSLDCFIFPLSTKLMFFLLRAKLKVTSLGMSSLILQMEFVFPYLGGTLFWHVTCLNGCLSVCLAHWTVSSLRARAKSCSPFNI